MTLVTISAAYGAGGSAVGPEVARRLGASFLDRAIPSAVSERLEVPLAEALNRDQSLGSALERMLVRMAPVAQAYGAGGLPTEAMLDDRAYQQATEDVLRTRAREGDAVILGRAGAIVLADEPGALHVRLGGPDERRVLRAMAADHVDQETAERHRRDSDRAREAYVRHFYRREPKDPDLYQLMLDSTVLSLEAVVEMIVVAARDRAANVASS